jgi:hypothetical protein
MFSEAEVINAFERRTGLSLQEGSRFHGHPSGLPPSVHNTPVGGDAPQGEFRINIDDVPDADEGVIDDGFSVIDKERGSIPFTVMAFAKRANVRVVWWPETNPTSKDPGDVARARWGDLIAFLDDL